MSEWIKASEMLPATRKKCLIYSAVIKEILQARFSLDDHEWIVLSGEYGFSADGMQRSITHWQYEPEEPNDI